jgi:Ca2+-binding RTX toxin-like protein
MGRRAILLGGALLTMVVVAAGVALAANITGTNDPDRLNGTENADKIAGSAKADIINGLGGNDQLFGDAGNDTVNGGDGSDNVQGGTGEDVAKGQSGDEDFVSVVDNDTNDFASGGEGDDDTCVVDLVNGVNDDFSASCETVLQTTNIAPDMTE